MYNIRVCLDKLRIIIIVKMLIGCFEVNCSLYFKGDVIEIWNSCKYLM